MPTLWDVETLRLSLFSAENVLVTDADWEAITGEKEAETRQHFPGGRRYSGNLANGNFALSTLGKRVDLVLSASPQPEGEDPTLRVVGSWDTTREEFVEKTRTWLGKYSTPIVRIAFGAVLLSETKDRRAGYEVLKSLLKSVNVDPDGMRDLIFRINWPAQSTVVSGLHLNRITNWGVIRFTTVLVQLSGDNAAASTTPQANAVRLEIDNNTDPQHLEPFDSKQLVPIYEELIALACENAAGGERP